jgi:hypoxanthine phosphoribosyltransferase
MAVTPDEAWQVYRQADCLHDERAVDAAIDRLAAGITQRWRDANPLLVCLMNGAVVTFGKLLPRLAFPLDIDYVHATRYGDKLVGADLKWLAGPFIEPRGRHVLLVDDILDEGATLAALEKFYLEKGAREVLKAVLVSKDRPRSVPVTADFTGLSVPDRYVFGCGMDYKGYLRNVPGIYAVAGS